MKKNKTNKQTDDPINGVWFQPPSQQEEYYRNLNFKRDKRAARIAKIKKCFSSFFSWCGNYLPTLFVIIIVISAVFMAVKTGLDAYIDYRIEKYNTPPTAYSWSNVYVTDGILIRTNEVRSLEVR